MKVKKRKIGKEILVGIVLDRSGSMSKVQCSTIEGYNQYLGELESKKETKYSVTTTLFDSPAGRIELSKLCSNTPIDKAPRLNVSNYEPRGMTPLYDAIGMTIHEMDAANDGRPKLLMIITDGYENDSKDYNNEQIKALIEKKEREGWTFVFMGANIDSYAVGSTIGLKSANVMNYTAGQEVATFAMAAVGTSNYASNRVATNSLRQASGEGFFDHVTKVEPPMIAIGSVEIKPLPIVKQTPAPRSTVGTHRPLR